jgi:hypothetical protein
MFDLTNVKAIPLGEPDVSLTVGLVVVERDPLTPLIAAFLSEARLLTAEPFSP